MPPTRNSAANPVEFIAEKRDGHTHCRDSFFQFLTAYVNGEVPDYQMAAWLMAAFIRGLDTQEKRWLTEAVASSGERLDLSHLPIPRVDKHSTGGVGDKTSLVLLPLLASAGVAVPMMSGRGLGHTGGTLDKLEAIPGMNVHLDMQQYVRILEQHGGVFMAQTPKIAPLDRKLYALRDVTGTVESVALITASIIGKKATESLTGLVLDVKCGNGAFMRDIGAARELARSLVETAGLMNMATVALITDMNEPLGEYVGCSAEVIEAVAMLKGENVEPRFAECTMRLATEMYCMAFPPAGVDDARATLSALIHSGKAFEKFAQVIHAQGVAEETIARLPQALPLAPLRVPVKAAASGFIAGVDTYRIGRLMVALGAGRGTMSDAVNHGITLRIFKHVGDRVAAGEAIGELMIDDDIDASAFTACYTIGDTAPPINPVVLERIA